MGITIIYGYMCVAAGLLLGLYIRDIIKFIKTQWRNTDNP